MDLTDDSNDHLTCPLLQLSNTKEAPVPPGDCGNLHAIANCLALLIGLGVLSSPYAVASGGLVSLSLNGLVAAAYFYTALLLVWCLEVDPTLTNFSDISRKALGRKGHVVATALLFTDLLSALVGYGISLSDNLVSAIPVGGHSEILGLKRRYFLTFAATLVLLPTVWVRRLKSLAWISASSIVSSILVLIALLWIAALDEVGIDQPIPFLHWEGISIASGIYLFTYGANIILPSVRASMVNKATFPKVLASSFIIAGTFYGGIGLLGASMFGSETESQITLNMPLGLIGSKLAVWANIITSVMKFSILLRPVAVELEAMLPWHADCTTHVLISMGIRTMLVIVLIVVSLCLPFFAYVISLVGSSLTVTLCVILPCWMYWSLFRGSIKAWEVALLLLVSIGGVGAGVTGTVISIVGIFKSSNS
ncbi:hypothetical protein L7F22_011278 [Adiantum nelumboides]|nr:hypothetical protein [Adiantum nelumboides]